MRYARINKNDIANGTGVCVSLWTQGCPHRCPGCHNPETWNFNGGIESTIDDIISEVLLAMGERGVSRNFSVLGGEPLACSNCELTRRAIEAVKENFPNAEVFLWTGYTLEDLNANQLEAIKNVDTLIDGRFVEELKNLTLKLRGSSNQRILHNEDIMKVYNEKVSK